MPSRVKLRSQPRRITSVMRNSARSMGYFLSDVVREYNPVLSELYDDNKETASNLYKAIKDFDVSFTDPKNLSKNLNETSKAIFQNFKDDMKSGNWYNKARQDKVIDYMGIMGFSDDDFDFGLDDDWGDFDDDDFNPDDVFEDDTKAIIGENQKSTQQIIASVDRKGNIANWYCYNCKFGFSG